MNLRHRGTQTASGQPSRVFGAALSAAVLLVGRSSPSPAPSAAEAPTTVSARTTSATPSASSTPSPAETAQPLTFTVECDGTEPDDYHEFWSLTKELDLSLCEDVDNNGGEPTAMQEAAWKRAGYDQLDEDDDFGDEDEPDITDVGALYSLCAEVEGYYTKKNNALSAEQAKEAAAMLMVCPDFPKAKQVRANLGYSTKVDREIRDGVRFFDGTYRVVKQIKPGTYFIPKTADDCYWERLDRKGNILANNLIHEGTRVEVRIWPSDYSFHAEGCGEWRRP
ncbi:hypothetical protein [Propioniciclava flava]|nr:hypothetical protein [Propioniciclava flava]